MKEAKKKIRKDKGELPPGVRWERERRIQSESVDERTAEWKRTEKERFQIVFRIFAEPGLVLEQTGRRNRAGMNHARRLVGK